MACLRPNTPASLGLSWSHVEGTTAERGARSCAELDRLGDQHRGTVQGPIHKQVLRSSRELSRQPSVPVEIERKFLVRPDDGPVAGALRASGSVRGISPDPTR